MHYLLMDDSTQRIAVLVETFKCLACFEGREVSHSTVLGHVMGALDVKEEEVGGNVYDAIFLLTGADPVVTNTPGAAGAGTTLQVSAITARWIKEGPGEPPDDDGGEE